MLMILKASFCYSFLAFWNPLSINDKDSFKLDCLVISIFPFSLTGAMIERGVNSSTSVLKYLVSPSLIIWI